MSDDDFMRYNLVTQFVCVQCGTQLALSYNKPRSSYDNPDACDGITGAAKVEQKIGIHPCRKCYAEATAPMTALRQALRQALGLQAGKQE